MKKSKIIVLIAIILVVGIAAVAIFLHFNNGTKDLAYNVEIAVYNAEGTSIYKEKVTTKSDNLLKALASIEELKVETEDSQYGPFIISIKDIKQGDNYYWNYYVNGNYATVSVSSCQIKENDKIEFRLEKFE